MRHSFSNLATLYSYNFIRASFVDIGTKAELSYLNQKGTIKISIIHCGTRVVQLKAQSVDLLLIAFLNRRGGRLPAVILVREIRKKKPQHFVPGLFLLSGWQDSNLRPSGPKPDARTGLRYTPKKCRNIKEPNHMLPGCATPRKGAVKINGIF